MILICTGSDHKPRYFRVSLAGLRSLEWLVLGAFLGDQEIPECRTRQSGQARGVLETCEAKLASAILCAQALDAQLSELCQGLSQTQAGYFQHSGEPGVPSCQPGMVMHSIFQFSYSFIMTETDKSFLYMQLLKAQLNCCFFFS